jgi:ABC-type nickel/cobalt efflux system permease component RcnA
MPTNLTRARIIPFWQALLALLAGAILLAAQAHAQGEAKRSPLAIAPQSAASAPRTPAVEPPSGAFAAGWAWIGEQQRRLTGEMTAAVRRVKAEGSVGAGVILAVASFLYGIFHAAGPGHGKFVISSYALANERTMRRGVLLAFLSSAIQALSAIAIVAVLALVVRASSVQFRATERWLELASWGLVALLGAGMLYGRLAPMLRRKPAAARQDHAHAHGHHHAHHHHGHDHDHTECCGHAHLPAPAALEGAWSWRQAMAIAFSIGIRPCTGAIVVLLFALNLGLWWAGVFATFAMALGTAITVSALAALAVGARDLATRFAGRESRWGTRIQAAAGLTGAALVFLLGAGFFIQSLTAPAPL